MKAILFLVAMLAALPLFAAQTWTGFGPSGAFVTALAPCATSRTVYAATSGAGVYKSEDDGLAWASASSGMEGIRADRGVISLVVDPEDCRTVYAGTYSDGLYKSVDGGVHWTSILPNASNVTALLAV